MTPTVFSYRRLLPFGGILAGIIAATWAATLLLQMQNAGPVSRGVLLTGWAAALGWCLFGLYSLLGINQGRQATPWRFAALHLFLLAGGSIVAELVAVNVSVPLATCLQLAAVVASSFMAWRIFKAAPQYRRFATGTASVFGISLLVWFLARQQMPTATITVAGIASMVVGFVVGLAALRLILHGAGFAAVAKTVVDEAIRMQVTLVLLMLFLLSLPIMPLLLDMGELLEYRVQFLLTWSLGATMVLLGLLNVFLGCGSLCGDVDTSRIHLTLTKPLGRLEYLFGKWLGLVAVNGLLVMLAGIGIFTFTKILAVAPAQSEADRRAVDQQVLVARRKIPAQHPAGKQFDIAIRKMIADLEKEVPDAFQADRRGTQAEIRRRMIRKWHTLDPDKRSEFVFPGLSSARDAEYVHLKIRPYAENTGYDGGDVRFSLWLNDRPFPYRDGEHYEYTLPGGVTHTIEIPTAAVDDKGLLKVGIQNKNLLMAGAKNPSWIQFVPGSGLELLAPTGGFTLNYVKGLLVIWFKLAMVAAVAVAASTFLGFPVAVLLSMMIFFSAFGNAFVNDSLEFYTGIDRADEGLRDMSRLRFSIFSDFIREGEYWEATKVIFAIFGELFVALIPSFNEYDSITQVATGLQVRSWKLIECFLRVAILAPISLGLLAWYCFERRDLVRSNT